jgi:hypothetical protein
MANSITHAALPYPIRGARYTLRIPFANPYSETPNFDTEISKNEGAFTDCTNELVRISDADVGTITLTETETDAYLIDLKASCIDGQRPTTVELRPKKLPVIVSGTLNTGGSTSSILAASAAGYAGAIIFFDSGTGSGQARFIESVSGSTVNFSALETNTDATTTYQILQTEFMASGGGSTPPTAGEIADEVRVELATELARIDVAISTRLATAGYTAPLDAAGVRSAVGLATNNLDTQLGDIPTVSEFNARTIVSANYALEATLTSMKGATFNGTTDSLEALRDRGDVAWTTGSSGLDAAGIRAALGLASANLDTQLADIPTTAEFNARTLASASYATAANQVTILFNQVTISGNVTDIETAVADIPTNAEFNARTLPFADYATAAGVAALPSATAIWDLAGAIDGKTPAEAVEIIAAACAGVTSGADTANVVFNGLNGTPRINATVSATGERTVVTYP